MVNVYLIQDQKLRKVVRSPTEDTATECVMFCVI